MHLSKIWENWDWNEIVSDKNTKIKELWEEICNNVEKITWKDWLFELLSTWKWLRKKWRENINFS